MEGSVHSLPIRDISVGKRLRRLNDAAVSEIAESISEIGQLAPILVKEVSVGMFALIAGWHRLEAFRRNDWKEIEAKVVSFDDERFGELAEIDENLVGSDLTVLDRAEHLKRRKELYEELHPETVSGQAQAAGMNRAQGRGDVSADTAFTSDTAQKTGRSRRVVEEDVQIATALPDDVKDQVADTPTADNKSELMKLAKMEPEKQRVIAEKLANGTAKDVTSAQRNDVHFSSASVEWYTPPDILDRIVKVMGAIDLDPCSDSADKPNAPATEAWAKADGDSLQKTWHGRVFMNPPYGREIEDWISYACAQYEEGHVSEAILLLPSRTDTKWFVRLRAYPLCFIVGRLHFSGHDNAAPFPSMCVYLGKQTGKFAAVFGEIGGIYAANPLV